MDKEFTVGPNDVLLTTEEVATRLGVTVPTLLAISPNDLPRLQIGTKTLRWPEKGLTEFLQSRLQVAA